MIEKSLQDRIYQLKGWLTHDEINFLYDFASRVLAGQVIVEIGSWEGKSTIATALGSKAGNQARVIAIDPHTGSQEHHDLWGKVDTFTNFQNNLATFGVTDTVEPLVMTSAAAVEHVGNNIGLLFIDGSHTFSDVMQDLRLWAPKVVDGGIIALHDSWHFSPVQLASALHLISASDAAQPHLVDTITYWYKVPDQGLKDKAGNLVFVLKRLLTGKQGFDRLPKTQS
jgi:precorrin-6B methylase 2